MIDKYKIKVINFVENIATSKDMFNFITIDTSLNRKEIKTNNNEFLKDVINNDDIVFIVCNNTLEKVLIKTAEIVKGLSVFSIGIGLDDKLLSNLTEYMDIIISIPSGNLKDITNTKNTTLNSALYYVIGCIASIISTKGLININLEDIKLFLKNDINLLTTIGYASSNVNVKEATLQAINALTNKDFSDVIINIVVDESSSIQEIESTIETIKKNVNKENINILYQVSLNKNKEISMTLIAFND